MARIILDTDVVVSALKSRNGASNRLLSLVGTDRFELVISNTLIVEYEAVLKRHFDHEAVDSVLDYLCRAGKQQELFYLWRPVLKDPDDDFILELAVASAAVIITHNVKDFAAASEYDIRTFTPKEYLRRNAWAPSV